MPGEPRDPAWWSFSTAGRISFGAGVSRFLPDVAGDLGRRVLICTDRNLVGSGAVTPIADLLSERPGIDVLVFDGGQAEIGSEAVERCAGQVRGFAPSLVVGIGGGSNLDLAKLVAARLVADTPVRAWLADGAPRAALPVVAVPTTAGSGSEVTPVAVLTDEERQLKVGLASPAFLPRAVLVDPELAVSCPQAVTAHSGMDALSHAIEAFMAISYADKAVQGYHDHAFCGKNPLSDSLALRAVSLISRHLVAAYQDGSDLTARSGMALGSLLAGMAFASAGTGVVHALQYPLGALTKTAHGHGNATLLPAVVQSNLGVRQAEAAELAAAMGSAAASGAEAAAALPGMIGDLALAVGITPNLRSIGVDDAQLGGIAAAAAGITRLTLNNPRPIDQDGLLSVLRDALDYAPPARGG
ncbi:MAG: iron-containing alcohol dehydrogenase [Streptosporangiaceae bacterium]|jgi:alcohol dehydrogenase class IV